MGGLRLVYSRQPVATPEATPAIGCLDTFDQELDYLYRTLQRMGVPRADVEDLLQDIFLTLHRHWHALDTTRSLRPWLFGVAFRVVSGQRRRRAREFPDQSLDPEDCAPNPEDWVQGQETLALLSAALEQVPMPRRSVLVQHELEGMEVSDIARRLSITKFGVYARLYKGRRELASAVRRLRTEKECVQP